MRALFGFFAVVMFASVVVGAVADNKRSEVPKNDQIDYLGFARLTMELESVRSKHRVTVEDFLKMAKDKDTIILDTRSKAAFDEVHLDGAIHLNFSDFTEPKLAKVIPNKKTRILIYCNNNFVAPQTPALTSKIAPLALNIPTFVNLHGYGYTNVYELADVLELIDTRVKLAGTHQTLRSKIR